VIIQLLPPLIAESNPRFLWVRHIQELKFY
jgi:hypothetical protein